MLLFIFSSLLNTRVHSFLPQTLTMLTFYSDLTIHSQTQQNHGGVFCLKLIPFGYPGWSSSELQDSKAIPPLMIQDFKLTSVNKASICWELDIFVYRLKISSVCQLRPLSNTDLIEPTTRTCSELLDTLSHPARFVWPVPFIAEQNSQKAQTYLKLVEVKFRQRWFEKEKMDPMKS